LFARRLWTRLGWRALPQQINRRHEGGSPRPISTRFPFSACLRRSTIGKDPIRTNFATLPA
jgi:hypothetical protein